MDLYTNAKVKHIIRPQPANIGLCFDEWIDIDSDLWQKECTEQIRRYQSIECSDGFSMDTSDECWKNLQVFPFTSDLFDEELCETRQYLVGAVGFIKYKNDIVVLEFCWLHPFWRNRGLLKKSWCEFSYHFGEFHISKPRTKTMQSFLDSVSYVEPKT